jgi:hypothetical protein
MLFYPTRKSVSTLQSASTQIPSMTETSKSWSNDLFFRALLHILGRELGIKDVKTGEDHSPCVIRHAAFLSSAAQQLRVATLITQSTQQEHQALAETVRVFILKPLREIQALAEKENIPAMDTWKTLSAEHGFDVQACFVLLLFALVANEVHHTKSPSGSSRDGYNSITLKARRSQRGVSAAGFTRGAVLIRLLIESFPSTGIMTLDLRKVFEKRLDKAYDKIRLYSLEERASEGTLSIPTTFVAIIQHLDTGSYEGLRGGEVAYRVQTGVWVDDPPKYEAQSDWRQESGARGCVIL